MNKKSSQTGESSSENSSSVEESGYERQGSFSSINQSHNHEILPSFS